MRLTDFKVLTFDCYGTLIDWETGIFRALQPLLIQGNLLKSKDEVLETFARFEAEQEAAAPAMRYSDLLEVVHAKLADHWGGMADSWNHRRFGRSVPDWPAFPDSAPALQYLKKHYRLVILSNVDRESFAGSNSWLKVDFDAIFTAEDIGSYKPDLRNFEYMLERLADRGYAASDVLHVAQSLFHDHAPATAMGLATAWVDRRHDQSGWGATPPPPTDARIDFHFNSMADLVRAHQRELGGAENESVQ